MCVYVNKTEQFYSRCRLLVGEEYLPRWPVPAKLVPRLDWINRNLTDSIKDAVYFDRAVLTSSALQEGTAKNLRVRFAVAKQETVP